MVSLLMYLVLQGIVCLLIVHGPEEVQQLPAFAEAFSFCIFSDRLGKA